MKQLTALFFVACLTLSRLLFPSGQLAKANDIELWYETFGEKKDPPLLLIMGGLCQGILWPTEFCEQLANKGFYVIRYDHRDSGLSTCLDFEKHPYTLLDMAKDTVGLLDALQIDQAHLCGLSMGGPIAELISVHFPTRVSTLTLIATSCDLPPDHSEALHAAIPGSRYLLIEGLGHVLNRQFYDVIIHTMEQYAKTR